MRYDWEKSKLWHELEMYAKILCELAGVPQAMSEKGVEMAKQLRDELKALCDHFRQFWDQEQT